MYPCLYECISVRNCACIYYVSTKFRFPLSRMAAGFYNVYFWLWNRMIIIVMWMISTVQTVERKVNLHFTYLWYFSLKFFIRASYWIHQQVIFSVICVYIFISVYYSSRNKRSSFCLTPKYDAFVKYPQCNA